MELLLNLVWLLLALPALWIWHARSRQRGNCSSLHCVLVLGCVLVLLFPVVSATDDLHAMCPAMEESSTFKRNARSAGAAKASVWSGRAEIQPALCALIFTFVPCFQYAGSTVTQSFLLRTAQPAVPSGRAPPVFLPV